MKLTGRPGGPLAGEPAIPGDKSCSHRALILGAMAVGETRITGLLEGQDVLDTASAMQALGAQALSIGPEIDPGVPWTLAEGAGPPLLMALESGNFGGRDFFLQAFERLA